MVPIFLRHLDFSSKRTLIVSWRKAMQIHQFRMVIRMLMMFAHKKGSEGTGRLWVIGLMTLISEKMPNEDSLEIMQSLMGLAVTELFGIEDSLRCGV
ncbi:hypothetical protein AB4391_14850 [Vibrio lentus]|nr:hypothetical protein [Vibrio lentus]